MLVRGSGATQKQPSRSGQVRQSAGPAAVLSAPGPEQGKQDMAVDTLRNAGERGVAVSTRKITVSMRNGDANLTLPGDFNFMSMYRNRDAGLGAWPAFAMEL